MSRVLCTFSGKFGDILWSLPTVRAVFQMVGGERVDFGIMPAYGSLLPLLNAQSYISKAFVVEDWDCTGSPYGDQPWLPPGHLIMRYERCFHLTYRCHPGIHRSPIPCIDFIAEQQGIKLTDPIPFITTAEQAGWYSIGPGGVKITGGAFIDRYDHVAYAFNPEAADVKERFLTRLQTSFDTHKPLAWVDVSKMQWLRAAALIREAVCFVGCRSANNVLAHGVGQKNIFIYEPDMSRHAGGFLGKCFGSPYTEEQTQGPNMTPEEAADYAGGIIAAWQEQSKAQEVTQ